MHKRPLLGLVTSQRTYYAGIEHEGSCYVRSPHCVSTLGPHGKNHGWRTPAARVSAQHLVLRQLYQILQPLLVDLHKQAPQESSAWRREQHLHYTVFCIGLTKTDRQGSKLRHQQ